MIQLLIYLVVVFIILGFVMWLIDYLPVQPPFNRWAKIAVILVGAIIIIGILLNVAGIDTGLPRGVR